MIHGLSMEFLGRHLDAVLRSNSTDESPESKENVRRPKVARVPLRRASSGSVEEGRQAGGSRFYALPSGWEDVDSASTSTFSEAQQPSSLSRFLQRMPWFDDGDEVPDAAGKAGMKVKIKSYLNNVRYGMKWSTRACSFDEDHPIWLLGKFYHSRRLITEPLPRSSIDAEIVTQVDSALFEFYNDFASKLWFTYRTGFPALGASSLESDCGWGCMLRSGQMVLAQALVLHLLGREWSNYEAQSLDSLRAYRRIVAFFGDSPACPLSIHNLVEEGSRRQGKAVGDWYGPGSVALVLRDLFTSPVVTTDPILSQLAVYVARDCAVYLDEIEALCCGESTNPTSSAPPPNGFVSSSARAPGPFGTVFTDSEQPDSFVRIEREELVGSSSTRSSAEEEAEWTKALVLFVPLRLGTQHLNRTYSHHLRTLLSLRNCLGLIGGKPKHSMYFLGFHADSLIYLDPHFAQDYVDTTKPGFETKSFHCHVPRKLELGELDPSLAVGFYCRSRAELATLLHELGGIVETEGTAAPRSAVLFSVLAAQPEPAVTAAVSHSAAARRAASSHGFELL